MTSDTRVLCKKFMSDPHEIRVDEESKLTLHGLLQYLSKLTEKEKDRKLNDLLDALEFTQAVILKSVQRAISLDKLLVESSFPSISIRSHLNLGTALPRKSSTSISENASWFPLTSSQGYRHRAHERSHKLRHARRQRRVPPTCPSHRALRNQRSHHQLRVHG